MANEIVTTAQDRMKQSLGSLQRDLGHIRAGRANASLLDRVQVVYYGAPTPLNQLASITIPEARVLMVTPFDKSILKDIEKALDVKVIVVDFTGEDLIEKLNEYKEEEI